MLLVQFTFDHGYHNIHHIYFSMKRFYSICLKFRSIFSNFRQKSGRNISCVVLDRLLSLCNIHLHMVMYMCLLHVYRYNSVCMSLYTCVCVYSMLYLLFSFYLWCVNQLAVIGSSLDRLVHILDLWRIFLGYSDVFLPCLNYTRLSHRILYDIDLSSGYIYI